MAEMAMQSAPIPGQEHYAGFWVRFLSVCVDLLISTPLYYGVMAVLGDYYRWYAEAVFIVFAILYYGFFFSCRWQATPGMRLLKVYITDTHGARISFMRALYWLISSVFLWAICFAGVIYLQSRFDIFAVRDLEMSCIQENIRQADCISEIESVINIPFPSFQQLIYASLALFAFMSCIWALSIALPKDKTGFHNLMCGTRFLQGRVQ
jgi:uncharacterized RDD family membrane protein YckC